MLNLICDRTDAMPVCDIAKLDHKDLLNLVEAAHALGLLYDFGLIGHLFDQLLQLDTRFDLNERNRFSRAGIDGFQRYRGGSLTCRAYCRDPSKAG